MIDLIQKFKEQINNQNLIHGKNILAKINSNNRIDILEKVIPHYNEFRSVNKNLIGFKDQIITKRVECLNSYYEYLKSKNYDQVFSSQSKFRSTILEEFMFYLFRDYLEEKKNEIGNTATEVLKLGSPKAYTNLYFKAKNVGEFINSPQIGINQKDQDFSIYMTLKLKIGNEVFRTNIPIISIENKTYIDKTMLEGSIATAEKIKSGNPYSYFCIVTERYDVSFDVDPAYSRIDQIYVLRKSKRSESRNKKIYPDVVIKLFKDSKEHFEKNWSDIEHKMKNFGRII